MSAVAGLAEGNLEQVTVADDLGDGLLLFVLPAPANPWGAWPVRGNLDRLAAQFLALVRNEAYPESQVVGWRGALANQQQPPYQGGPVVGERAAVYLPRDGRVRNDRIR